MKCLRRSTEAEGKCKGPGARWCLVMSCVTWGRASDRKRSRKWNHRGDGRNWRRKGCRGPCEHCIGLSVIWRKRDLCFFSSQLAVLIELHLMSTPPGLWVEICFFIYSCTIMDSVLLFWRTFRLWSGCSFPLPFWCFCSVCWSVGFLGQGSCVYLILIDIVGYSQER